MDAVVATQKQWSSRDSSIFVVMATALEVAVAWSPSVAHRWGRHFTLRLLEQVKKNWLIFLHFQNLCNIDIGMDNKEVIECLCQY